ncbi:Uncharacterized protein HZ326_25997 [Fusarium oxysporum f. sp. albedinis]|nr:Uncharacterized protein HZ326_25997 [Fusarium oxysporum f. sp. albedinis]
MMLNIRTLVAKEKKKKRKKKVEQITRKKLANQDLQLMPSHGHYDPVRVVRSGSRPTPSYVLRTRVVGTGTRREVGIFSRNSDKPYLFKRHKIAMPSQGGQANQNK